jgi:hypothetical protein
MSRPDYRPFVPAPGQSRIAGSTPRAHAEARMQSPRAQELFGGWAELAKAPFTGITTDGHVMPGLFPLQPSEAPTPAMIAAVTALLGSVSPAQRVAMSFPSSPTCGAVGRTPSSMSKTTGCASMKRRIPCARRSWTCCARA